MLVVIDVGPNIGTALSTQRDTVLQCSLYIAYKIVLK